MQQRHNEGRADRVIQFFETVLVHTKGVYAGKPFILTDWQKDEIIRPLFGQETYNEQNATWIRQYRTAWIELGRGNGKSELLAGIALYLLVADGEAGAEIYGAATTRDQAAAVYRVAKRMVELSPALSKRLEVKDHIKRIVYPETDSYYAVIAADAGTALGQNPHGILFDELLTQSKRDLWDSLKTGMGKRTQPLMIAATTAGNDTSEANFAFQEHEYSRQVAEGTVTDPQRFVYMRNTPTDVDWQEEANWYHANPGLGDFVQIDFLRSEAKEAASNPRYQNTFRQFYLNQWVNQRTRWIDMAAWDANGEPFDPAELVLERCYGGLDLSATSDFTAWVLAFPRDDGSYKVLPRLFLPRAAVERRSSMKATLEVWEREGFLTVTEGEAVDYSVVENQIIQDCTNFNVRELAADPWNAQATLQNLMQQDINVVECRQNYQSLSGPAKELERLIAFRKVNHGDNPILRWMADNVMVITDPSGNIRPDKKNSSEKIDGIVALIMALGAAIREANSGDAEMHFWIA